MFTKCAGATTTDLPAGVLYRVKATYKYVKEDVDELSFDVGETIQVIEYDDPEDQVIEISIRANSNCIPNISIHTISLTSIAGGRMANGTERRHN